MAFPTTPVLDTFTVADGALPAEWTAPVFNGNATPTVKTNTVITGVSVFGSAYYNPMPGVGAAEAYLTVPASATSHSQATLFARLKNPGSTTTICCYYVLFDATGGIDVTRIVNAGSSGSLLHIANNTSAGHKCGMEVTTVGDDIIVKVYKDTGSGWTLLDFYTDTGRVSVTPALLDGYIGFRVFGNNAVTRAIDDFGGGEIGGGGGGSGGGTNLALLGVG